VGALQYCLAEGLTPILLGDLFDSRCGTSDSVGVYRAVRQIEEQIPGTIILQSNHQNKLIRLLKGNKVKVFGGLQTTMEDFKDAGCTMANMVDLVLPWLEAMPYGFVFRDSSGTEYRCAHACFPRRLIVPEYEGSHLIMADSLQRKEMDTMLYGPFYKVTTEDGKSSSERLPWWLEDDGNSWVRVAGHYHKVHIGNNNLVLDGQMGGSSQNEIDPEDMRLCLYEGGSGLRYFGYDGTLLPQST
jgi:hypothetical protein